MPPKTPIHAEQRAAPNSTMGSGEAAVPATKRRNGQVSCGEGATGPQEEPSRKRRRAPGAHIELDRVTCYEEKSHRKGDRHTMRLAIAAIDADIKSMGPLLAHYRPYGPEPRQSLMLEGAYAQLAELTEKLTRVLETQGAERFLRYQGEDLPALDKPFCRQSTRYLQQEIAKLNRNPDHFAPNVRGEHKRSSMLEGHREHLDQILKNLEKLNNGEEVEQPAWSWPKQDAEKQKLEEIIAKANAQASSKKPGEQPHQPGKKDVLVPDFVDDMDKDEADGDGDRVNAQLSGGGNPSAVADTPSMLAPGDQTAPLVLAKLDDIFTTLRPDQGTSTNFADLTTIQTGTNGGGYAGVEASGSPGGACTQIESDDAASVGEIREREFKSGNGVTFAEIRRFGGARTGYEDDDAPSVGETPEREVEGQDGATSEKTGYFGGAGAGRQDASAAELVIAPDSGEDLEGCESIDGGCD